MAETCYLPVAPHNGGGPSLDAASAQLAANLPILFLLDTVRRHYREDYPPMVNTMLKQVEGRLPLPGGPGLGIELLQKVFSAPSVALTRISQ